jgi:hypothetical protein
MLLFNPVYLLEMIMKVEFHPLDYPEIVEFIEYDNWRGLTEFIKTLIREESNPQETLQKALSTILRSTAMPGVNLERSSLLFVIEIGAADNTTCYANWGGTRLINLGAYERTKRYSGGETIQGLGEKFEDILNDMVLDIKNNGYFRIYPFSEYENSHEL